MYSAYCVGSISGVREAIHSVAVTSTSESCTFQFRMDAKAGLAALASRLNRIFARLQFLMNIFSKREMHAK